MRKLEQTEKDRVLFIVSDKLGYFEEEIDDTSSLRNDLFADLPDDQRGFDIEVNEEENVQKENPKISSKKPQKAGLNVA